MAPRPGRNRNPRPPPEPPGREAALELALGFLGSRPRTRWELERRLRRGGADDAVVEATVDRLAAMGYLDDAAFAQWWADQRDRHAPRGRRMVEAELRQRGVPREVIEAHRESGFVSDRPPEDADMPSTDEERAAIALARHLRGRPLPTDRRALQRIGMFLVRRGFEPEVVRGALRSATDTDPDEG